MATTESWARLRTRIPTPIRGAGWRLLHTFRPERPGLLMHWAAGSSPAPAPLRPGFELRQWQAGDDDAWLALFNRSGAFGTWDRARMDVETRNTVRRCQEFITTDGKIVAAAGVTDRPLGRRPALEISWVVRDPAHAGAGLGRAVLVAAVRAALAEPGERPVYLHTDDHRLTAIALYLELGFAPDLHRHRSYSARWENVFRRLALRGPAPRNA